MAGTRVLEESGGSGMSNVYDQVEGIAKRTMVLFFLVDKSYSMDGTKIGAVNEAINDVIPEIVQIANEGADAELRISVLTFSHGAEWMFPEPVKVEDFRWKYLDAAGATDMGRAFSMLSEKMDRKGYMGDARGFYAPAVILMSDGQPTDAFQEQLELLKKNKWFQVALKAAVSIGEDADKRVLAEFTGNVETVLTAHTPETLKKIIRFVSVTSSAVGSKGGSGTDTGDGVTTKQDAFVQQVQEYSGTIQDAEDDWGTP
jgi:uncharacterized protein YegL